MRSSVRHLDRQFFDRIMVYRIIWFALATASMVLGLFLYLLSHNYPYEIAMSAAFTTLVVAQWINAILSQKESEPFFKNIRTSFTINPWIWVGVAAGIGLQTIALYILPEWFHVVPPTAEILGYILIASLGILLMAEGYKWIEYRFHSIQKFS